MRIAALGDVHGNLAALDAVLADITRLGYYPSQLVVAGDIAIAGPQPGKVVTRLRVLEGAGATIIAGNVDRWPQDYFPADYCPAPGPAGFLVGSFRLAQAQLSGSDWQWLLALPEQRRLPDDPYLPGSIVVHSPRSSAQGLLPDCSDEELLAVLAGMPPDIGALICAHTHRPMVRVVAQRLVVNVGSVGRPNDGDPRASYALVSYRDGRWDARIRRVRYDVEATIRAANEAGLPEIEWYADVLRTGTLGIA